MDVSGDTKDQGLKFMERNDQNSNLVEHRP
jgi:hypothetical protein